MEPTDENIKAWDAVHGRAAAEEAGIPAHVRERLPDVKGKHVLHLQCGTGVMSAELAELGALVTGVDLSTEALARAHELAPSGAFVHADSQSLPLELRRGRFDLVFTGGGVIGWLQDLESWAAGIFAALRTRGALFLYEEHPVVGCLDPALRWRDDYFDEDVLAGAGTRNERFWRLGQIVTAIAETGLVIRRLEEFPSPGSRRRQDPRVPGELVLVAEKP
jgi:SAM-dependent methyltransferase